MNAVIQNALEHLGFFDSELGLFKNANSNALDLIEDSTNTNWVSSCFFELISEGHHRFCYNSATGIWMYSETYLERYSGLWKSSLVASQIRCYHETGCLQLKRQLKHVKAQQIRFFLGFFLAVNNCWKLLITRRVASLCSQMTNLLRTGSFVNVCSN